MMLKLWVSVLTLSVMGMGLTVPAAESAPAATATESATEKVPVSAFTPENLQKAYTLMETMQMEQQMQQTISAMLDIQLRAAPQLKPYQSILEGFFKRYLSYESIKESYAKLYLEVYTPEELVELTKFYRSALGQKVIAATPVLTVKGAELGQATVAAHIGELQSALQKAMSQQTASAVPDDGEDVEIDAESEAVLTAPQDNEETAPAEPAAK